SAFRRRDRTAAAGGATPAERDAQGDHSLMHRHLTAVLDVLILGVVVLTGCGGTSSASESSNHAPPTRHAPPGNPVARALAASLGATDATCLREGWMVFVGERETVYGCTTEADVSRSERCYVYIDGAVEDVTD